MTYPVLIVSSLFIGGAGENFALLTVIGLLTFVYLRYLKKIAIPFPKLLTATFVCLIAFSFSIFAAGTEVRLDNEGQRTLVGLLKSIVHSYGYFIDAYELPRVGARLFLLTPFLLIGSYWSDAQLKLLFKNYWKYFLGFVLLLLASFLPTIYALTYLGTARTLSYANLLLTGFIIFTYIILGSQLKENGISFYRLAILGIVLFAFFICKAWTIQLPDSQRYVISLNDRLNRIQTAAAPEEGDLLELENLYYSPWVVYEVHQFREDPGFFGNACTKAVLNIPFKLKVSPADRRIPKHPLSE